MDHTFNFFLRQAIPAGARSFDDAQAQHQARRFYQRIEDIPLDQGILLQLYELGFEKQSLPLGQFHKHFPKAAQVNKYESTAAFAYTNENVFATEQSLPMR